MNRIVKEKFQIIPSELHIEMSAIKGSKLSANKLAIVSHRNNYGNKINYENKTSCDSFS